MDLFFLTFMSTMFCLLGGIIGCIIVGPFEDKGRATLRRQLFIATIAAVVWIALPIYIWGTGMFFHRWDASFAIALVIAMPLGIWIGALIAWLLTPEHVLKFLDMVPKVGPVGLRNFKLLDVDEDGVVSHGDLGHAKQQIGPFTDEDLKVIAFMQSYISTIGHGVGSYTTYNAATKTTSSTQVCVISPRDLESFEARMNEKYAAWMEEARSRRQVATN